MTNAPLIPPKAALSRADVLRLLVAWGKGAEQAVAGITGFGFAEEAKGVVKELGGVCSITMDVAQVDMPAAAPIQMRAEHYHASLQPIATTAAMEDFKQGQQAILQAQDAAPQVPDGPLPPAWQALSPAHRLTVFVEQHLRSQQNSSGWDIPRLMQQMAEGELPNKRRARQQRLRWRNNALVIFQNRKSVSLHQDYTMLAGIAQRRSGASVPIYRLDQERGWAVYDPAHFAACAVPEYWRPLAQAPALTNMRGLAVGCPTEFPHGWQAQALLTAHVQAEKVMPAIPLAAWDVARKLTPRRVWPSTEQTKPTQIAALLALMSLAVIVHPPLLRALRCLLGLPASCELLAWGSSEVSSAGFAIAVRRARREHYLGMLRDTLALPLRQQAASLIAAHHSQLSLATRTEEAFLAEQYAPGAQVLASRAYFAHWARLLASEADSVEAGELRSYFQRQGHRTVAEAWQVSKEYLAAWTQANKEAIARGEGLPESMPLALLHQLRQQVLIDKGEQKQVLRLLQVDQQLRFEVGQAQTRNPPLLEWECGPLVEWRYLGEATWQKPQALSKLAVLPLGVGLELFDGEQLCVVRHVERPAWAQAWARDRDGLYALVPNPWGQTVRLGYPFVAQRLKHYQPQVEPKKGFSLEALKQSVLRKKAPTLSKIQLSVDAIGPFAEFTILAANGEHSQLLRYIPPGQFVMGSPESELERNDDEGPQHLVTISQGFWLADTACTQGLWQAIMGENPSHFNQKNHGSAQHPVENVSWDEVQIFLQKLASLLPSCQPSLPTEAEWEYACRAGTSTPFSFGTTISAEQVNYYGDSYDGGPQGECRGHTVAVKELPANSSGLYQMHGNVWEWCADAPRDYGVDAVVDPGLLDDVAVKDLRVLRGGGWINSARYARSAYRGQGGPGGRSDDVGFRFVLRSSR